MAKAKMKSRKNLKGFSPEKAAELYKRLAKQRPDPRTELEYKDPFTLLVSVVLSAQATDVSVNKATPALFAEADTPAKMVRLGEAGIARMFWPCRGSSLSSTAGKRRERERSWKLFPAWATRPRASC
jgi:hypothetical protein